MNLTDKPIRVVHFPQVGSGVKPFVVPVLNEREAYLIKNTLANQHLYLFDNNVIPDYSNVIIVECFEKEHNEWHDYYNDEECMSFDEFAETYLEEIVTSVGV